jgi:protein ImuB
MRVSDAEVLLDVSGLGALIGAPPLIATELARAARDAGVQASVAIASTQTTARLLATQEAGCPVTRLPDLPVSLLQPLETLPPAMNPRDRARPYETFERWGIATLGDLVALPAPELSSRLGRRGVALQRLARGLDPRPFVPDGETPRYIGRLELEWPIDALEPLSFVLARLLDPLSVALERADRGAAAIRLDLRLTDRSTHARLLQLPAPMRDARVLRTLLLLDLESHPPSPLSGFGETGPPAAAVDVVAIEIDPAPARITQFSLLQRALPSPETLSTLTARLSTLVGDSRVGSPVLEDSHRPDAFAMARYAPEKGAEGAEGAKGAGAKGAEGAKGAAKGAEGADGAMALVLRRQRIPPAIRVSVERGRPVYLAASKRGMPYGTVTQAAGPWRTSGDWWAQGWNRDEWDIALSSGIACRIFQDRTTERWFLEGVYD